MKKLLLLLFIGFTVKLSSQTSAYLDINNVKAVIQNRNDMFWDVIPNSGYECPKNSGKHCNFVNSVWIGGLDAGNQLHIGAMTYRQNGVDFWPGPLDTVNGLCDQATSSSFDRVWKINYTDLINFFNNQIATADMSTWPGNGNIAQQYQQNLAPFVDVNADGIYSAASGDYPKIKGDQMIWYTVNDKIGNHGETGGLPLGIQMDVSAYAYGCPSTISQFPELNHTTFYDYKIYNRSNIQYNSAYITIWSDADLGYYLDDYIGCDPQNHLGYMYNSDPNDNGIYGNYPPILSYQILNGPLADPLDGLDNDGNGQTDEPGEQCKFNNFMHYNNNIGAFLPATTNPNAAVDYYNYMKSIWKNGQPLKGDSAGYLAGNIAATKFAFPGNPQTNTGWTEYLRNNPPGDRRFMISCGPFTLKPNAVHEFEFSIHTTFDSTANGYKNISKVQSENAAIRNFYNMPNKPNCSLFPNGLKENTAKSFDLQVSPNPGDGIFTIRASQKMRGSILKLYNCLGEIVFTEKISSDVYELNISQQPSGVYFADISGDNFHACKKLVKN